MAPALSNARGSGLPLGGTGLTCEAYLAFLAEEYLGGYLRSGGAAVRFLVAGDDGVNRRWHAGLAAAAEAAGYRYVAVDAAETKVAMVDALYAAVARQIEWIELARETVHAAWQHVGLPPPTLRAVTVAAVAAAHRLDAREAARSIRRHLEATVLGDASLSREFRLALLRLCQAELDTGDVNAVERDAVLSWLRVEPVTLRALQAASIYGRVGRHNARGLLTSLASWSLQTSGSGLVLDLDLTRLAVTRRPPAEAREGLYYSKAAVLDTYEVLRQLVDATDHLRGTLVAVTLPPELVTDECRGLPAYSALQLRIVDEVRDRRRPNPYAALIRLESRLEVVR